MTKLTRRSVLSGASALAIAPAYAQGGRTITLMHGFTPGANVDLVARLVADNLSKRLGQPIVVESRPGAGNVDTVIVDGIVRKENGKLTFPADVLASRLGQLAESGARIMHEAGYRVATAPD